MGQSREHWIARAYDALGPGLYRYALMILGDASLAEDAVQQAFMRLVGRGRVDDVTAVKGFLRVVVRHEAYRILARRRPTETVENLNLGEPLLETVGAEVERGEERGQVERALRQLPAEQREVIHLKVWEGMTFAEIAELLAIPANTAASRYRYAIERLRDYLKTMEGSADDDG